MSPGRRGQTASRSRKNGIRPETERGTTPRTANIRQPKAAAPDPEVHRFLAAYIIGVGNRLSKGASNFYRKHYSLGMSEWRTMMAIGTSNHRIVREVAEMADLDYAAASKSLRLLQNRGLVNIKQTNRRGRAVIASLTPKGLQAYQKLRAEGLRRQRRLVKAFSSEEITQLWALLQRVEKQISHMNAAE